MGAISDVVFDLCGVLVDWQPARAIEGRAPRQVVRDFVSFGDRCGFLYFDDVLDGGADFEETARAYESERGAELARVFRAYYANIGRSLVGVMPGMESLVRELHAAGIRCWGLTNWSRRCAGAFETRFPELIALLDGVQVSGVEGVKKPDEAAFRLAELRFGLTPGRVAFFDDNSLNAEAAVRCGWHAFSFVDAAHARASLRSLGVRVSAGEGEGPAGQARPAPREMTFSLVPQGEGARARWASVPVSELVLPALGNPYDGRNDEAFWLERYREYRGLAWSELDWRAIRRGLVDAAGRLGLGPAPELGFTVPGLDERMFIEMWFGYGDPPVAASLDVDGRYLVTHGQHRICALMDFPMADGDRELLGLGAEGFAPGGPLGPNTCIPVLVTGEGGVRIAA